MYKRHDSAIILKAYESVEEVLNFAFPSTTKDNGIA